MLAKRRLLGFGRSIRLRLRHGAQPTLPLRGEGGATASRGLIYDSGLRPDQRDHNPAGNLSAGVLPARFGEN